MQYIGIVYGLGTPAQQQTPQHHQNSGENGLNYVYTLLSNVRTRLRDHSTKNTIAADSDHCPPNPSIPAAMDARMV